ncbi:Ddb1- And Cul4-Associated Factor 8 [Manis pentadactyla]|nr:Ddb1- And Cul4-Associated Factor 8 [Manis pentadactyla]
MKRRRRGPRSPDSPGEERDLEPELRRERGSLRQPGASSPPSGEDKQEVLGVPAEVCFPFSLTHSENGAIHPGAVSQLHSRPDYCYPDVATGGEFGPESEDTEFSNPCDETVAASSAVGGTW